MIELERGQRIRSEHLYTGEQPAERGEFTLYTVNRENYSNLTIVDMHVLHFLLGKDIKI